jgi:hypothetical protein
MDYVRLLGIFVRRLLTIQLAFHSIGLEIIFDYKRYFLSALLQQQQQQQRYPTLALLNPSCPDE